MKRNILGPRIRESRRETGITQADLARKIGISASYLNLIEHNKRDIGGTLLRKLAEALEIPLNQLDGATDRRLLESLEEISMNPAIKALEVEDNRIGELIGRFPGWSRGILALSRSEQQATTTSQILSDRLNHDPFLGETVHKMLTRIASLNSSSEILNQYSQIDAVQRDRFYAIMHEESRKLCELGDALASYFDNAAMAKRKLTPLDEIDAFFDNRHNHFSEIEAQADSLHAKLPDGTASTRFNAAEALVKKRLDKLVKKIVAAELQLETEVARTRSYQILLRYAVGAVLVPIEALRQQALEMRYDLEMLSDYFGVDFQLIGNRLSALPVVDGEPRFGFYQANASGNITLARNLPSLLVPRYGSSCPLWILYRAQQTPHTVLRQHVQLPSGEGFVFVARAASTGAVGFGQPRHFLTDMSVISEQDAQLTIYAPERSTTIEPVGLSCRTCPRRNCKHRIIDPISG